MFVENFRKLDFEQWSRFYMWENVDQKICIPAKNMPVVAGRVVIFRRI